MPHGRDENDRIDIYCLRTVSTLKFTHFRVGAGFYSAREREFYNGSQPKFAHFHVGAGFYSARERARIVPPQT